MTKLRKLTTSDQLEKWGQQERLRHSDLVQGVNRGWSGIRIMWIYKNGKKIAATVCKLGGKSPDPRKDVLTVFPIHKRVECLFYLRKAVFREESSQRERGSGKFLLALAIYIYIYVHTKKRNKLNEFKWEKREAE